MAGRIHLQNTKEAATSSGLPAALRASANALSDKKIRRNAAGAPDGQEHQDRQPEIAEHFIGHNPDDLIRIYIKKPGVFPRKEHMMESGEETVKIKCRDRGKDPEDQKHAYRPPEQRASV